MITSHITTYKDYTMPANDAFPDDENGHTLKKIADYGTDLSQSYLIDFNHLLPDESAAKRFSEAARALGYQVEVYQPEDEDLEEGDTDWDICCKKQMIPTHQAITAAEKELAGLADSFGGCSDGWGFMAD